MAEASSRVSLSLSLLSFSRERRKEEKKAEILEHSSIIRAPNGRWMAPSTGERGRRGRLNSTIKAICFLSRLSGSGIVLWPVCGGKFESGGARGMPGRVPISGGWMGRDDDDGGRSKKAAYIRISPLAKSSREIGGLFFFERTTVDGEIDRWIHQFRFFRRFLFARLLSCDGNREGSRGRSNWRRGRRPLRKPRIL